MQRRHKEVEGRSGHGSWPTLHIAPFCVFEYCDGREEFLGDFSCRESGIFFCLTEELDSPFVLQGVLPRLLLFIGRVTAVGPDDFCILAIME